MNVAIDTHQELSATATHESVRRLRSQAAEIAGHAGAGTETVEHVRLAVNEALANVVTHAYEGKDGPVEMTVEADDAELTVVVRDHGYGVEQRRSTGGAGYGMLIIERLTVRSSVFSTLGRGTVVTMVFRLLP